MSANMMAKYQANYIPKLPPNFYYNQQPSGPPAPQYAYPYYTTRAPRDFLMANPPSIGP